MRDPNYRPAVIEFDVAHDGSNIPETFGEFATAEEAVKFMGGTFIAVNHALTVARHMDIKEKTEIRRDYNDILENELPSKERELVVASQEYNTAKKKKEDCQELVNAALYEAKSLAFEVKRGLVDVQLDDMFTWRLPYKGRYYFFTYMDKQLKLCAIRDIPELEKGELWNSMADNEKVIDTNSLDGKTEPQKGPKK